MSKCVAQNTFHDICIILINKTETTNTGHFEARTSMFYSVHIVIYESAVELFIAASTQNITASSLIIFWKTSKKSEGTTYDLIT